MTTEEINELLRALEIYKNYGAVGESFAERTRSVCSEFVRLRVELEKARVREKTLRCMLWLRHGCSIEVLYGDDGEMQCGHCKTDFLRDDPANIRERWAEAGRKEISAALAPAASREKRIVCPEFSEIVEPMFGGPASAVKEKQNG